MFFSVGGGRWWWGFRCFVLGFRCFGVFVVLGFPFPLVSRQSSKFCLLLRCNTDLFTEHVSKRNGEAELLSAQIGDCSTLASFANESLKAFTCQERKTHSKEFSTELGLLSF